MGRKKKEDTKKTTKKKDIIEEDYEEDYDFTTEMDDEMKEKVRMLNELENNTSDEDDQEDLDEDNFSDNDLNSNDLNDEEEDYSNSLQIAGDIHKLSPIYKQFPQLPKEVQYAYYDNKDKNMVRWNSKLYHQFKHYIQKVLFIADKEVIKEEILSKSFYKLSNKEEIRDYFKLVNKQYLYYNLMSMDEEDRERAFRIILETLKRARDNDLVELMYCEDSTDIVFKDYENEFGKNVSVDPFGLINNILTINETSKGYKGNMIKTMRTTINENKNVDLLRDNEDDSPEESTGFGAKVKSAFSRKKREDTYD